MVAVGSAGIVSDSEQAGRFVVSCGSPWACQWELQESSECAKEAVRYITRRCCGTNRLCSVPCKSCRHWAGPKSSSLLTLFCLLAQYFPCCEQQKWGKLSVIILQSCSETAELSQRTCLMSHQCSQIINNICHLHGFCCCPTWNCCRNLQTFLFVLVRTAGFFMPPQMVHVNNCGSPTYNLLVLTCSFQGTRIILLTSQDDLQACQEHEEARKRSEEAKTLTARLLQEPSVQGNRRLESLAAYLSVSIEGWAF